MKAIRNISYRLSEIAVVTDTGRTKTMSSFFIVLRV